jgi:hypothetical protein
VDILYIVPGMPGLSVTIVVAGSMIFLFFARESVHKLICALSEGTAGGLKKIATWAKSTVKKMREKDRKVLLESGVANIQHKIQQEFTKIEINNAKVLANYPKLQLRLDEEIATIQTDYKDCGHWIPEAPGWGDVVSGIEWTQKSAKNVVIRSAIEDIYTRALESEKKALSEFREVTAKRHKILNSMAPVWKRIEKMCKDINTKFNQVLENNKRIDLYMEEYTKLVKADSDSIDVLAARVTKLFIVSLIVLCAGIAGAFVNFNLIALPMSELVPQGTRVGGMAVSEVSALVIVVLELVLGIFLMEAMGITSTFPQFGAMTSGKRKIILFGTLLGLLFLSSVEASLAVLREQLAASNMALDQALAGIAVTASSNEGLQVTVIGQATLGFVLPWILAMIAIPLEMFIGASQHAFTRITILMVTMLGHIANGMAYIVEGLLKISSHLFDIYIILPTKVNELVRDRKMDRKMDRKIDRKIDGLFNDNDKSVDQNQDPIEKIDFGATARLRKIKSR